MTDERFLFKPDTGEVFTLNPTGALVYRLARQGKRSSDIARRLAARYQVSEAQALRDVHACLAELRVNGFLID